MKLHTSIPPRRDGTVKVTGQDRQTYVFEVDADGELSCDVTDEATIAFLLAGGMFWPADTKDFPQAESLVAPDEADDEPDDNDEPSMDALPVEAETPPAPKRARKAKAE